jgi:hypothetical protein
VVVYVTSLSLGSIRSIRHDHLDGPLDQGSRLGAPSRVRTGSEEVATGGGSEDAKDGLKSVEVNPRVETLTHKDPTG